MSTTVSVDLPDPWPLGDRHGLHVDFGAYDTRVGRWLRTPTAAYRCACGWRRTADGAPDVTDLTAARIPAHCDACPRHRDARTAR
ncbi:hypothetical protein [Streptomyces sp. NPDC048392]|uniref:hypothetical protein n=1 Tax=Streptomyces sp. NPDC048392 TaxID=3365543 RepID=UPI003711D4EC